MVVVGAGITGVTAALLLAERGKRVHVLEARSAGAGVTGCSSAHLTEAIDTRYFELEQWFSKDAVAEVARSKRRAIDLIGLRAESMPDHAGLEVVPGYLFAESKEDEEELDREYEAANRAGCRVTRISREELPFERSGALRFEVQAQIDPLRYLDGLIDQAIAQGVTFHEDSRVIALEDGEPAIAHLENGVEVRASFILACTHTAPAKIFLQNKVVPHLSYLAAFELPHGFPNALYWNTLDPYHYLRRADVGGKAHLLIGGEDHRTGAERDQESRFQALRKYAHTLLGVAAPMFEWSDQVFDSLDGLPFIGPKPRGERVLFASGFGGNGLTFGTLAAEIMAERVLGRSTRFEEIYRAHRLLPPRTLPDFAAAAAEEMFHLASDWVRPADESDVNQVQPGEGKIVRVRGRRLAVYRDPQGQLSAVSPICTHLGCMVSWNAAETSWDCACHGSRFDTEGKVLSGPAVKALAARQVHQGDAEPLTAEDPLPDSPTFDLLRTEQ